MVSFSLGCAAPQHPRAVKRAELVLPRVSCSLGAAGAAGSKEKGLKSNWVGDARHDVADPQHRSGEGRACVSMQSPRGQFGAICASQTPAGFLGGCLSGDRRVLLGIPGRTRTSGHRTGAVVRGLLL